MKTVVSDKTTATPNKAWFVYVILYLVIDYGRPQDVIPIGFIRPSMLIILALCWFLFTTQQLKYSKSKQSKMILMFVLLLMVLTPFAFNEYRAFETAKAMVLYLPFILSTIICVTSIGRLRVLITTNIILMIYVAQYALTHGGVGSGNYFADENDVSLYLNTWIPFCYFLFLSEKRLKHRLIYATGVIIGVIAVVVSFSRGGFIGMVAMGAVMWIFSKKKVVSLITILLLGLLVWQFGGEAYRKEMSTISNTEEGTANERMISWGASWRMFLDNPLGVGGGNFPRLFSEYQPKDYHKSMWGRAAHSLWFMLMPETGVIGIAIYLMLLWYNIQDIFFLRDIKAENDGDQIYLKSLGCACIASFAGYFASATFISVLYYAHYWYLTAMIVAAVNVAKSLKRDEGRIVENGSAPIAA